MNQTVRSRFTPPERRFFKPSPLQAPSNPLNYRAFNIRTKMAVVRLLRRKWCEKDGKWPEVGLAAAARGSDNDRRSPHSAGFRPRISSGKRMSRQDVLAEGSSLAANTLFAGVRGALDAQPETPEGEIGFTRGQARPS
jgi:hypothetical protein